MSSQPKPYDPAKDIPDLADKVIFITGGTTGLGKETVLALARHRPKQIWFSGRKSERAAEVISAVKAQSPAVDVSYIQCDQIDLASVEAGVKKLVSATETLDILICNAGVMGTDPALTKDGYESQFGINHVAHALMIKMLLPSLQRAATQKGDARIVFLSSTGFRWTPSSGIVFKDLKTTQDYAFAGRWVRYGQSKLANVVYAAELTRRYPELTSVAVHPGVIWTELNSTLTAFDRAFVCIATLGKKVPPHEGVYNTLWAATTSKKNIKSGAFYEPVGRVTPHTKDSESTDLGEHLWIWTRDELKNLGN
ncbi:MAG: hypothetical protein M1816_002205 [Peltula sp. TS41687]|nr:MAG: hypothetical protein M1816_002205 [Peltula sp. TS41687]